MLKNYRDAEERGIEACPNVDDKFAFHYVGGTRGITSIGIILFKPTPALADATATLIGNEYQCYQNFPFAAHLATPTELDACHVKLSPADNHLLTLKRFPKDEIRHNVSQSAISILNDSFRNEDVLKILHDNCSTPFLQSGFKILDKRDNCECRYNYDDSEYLYARERKSKKRKGMVMNGDRGGQTIEENTIIKNIVPDDFVTNTFYHIFANRVFVKYFEKRHTIGSLVDRHETVFACPLEIMRPPDTWSGEWLTPRSIIQPALAPLWMCLGEEGKGCWYKLLDTEIEQL
ncbi:hypothetical protein WN51_01248 [Melipona quadrifasciata]|uniref:Uncharacterized protein n=1 Tax=Melipona quadrifasciata TaxID=166423 RepID=A0A0M8ZZB4_9HYME|nr:hypothetical protein WN51_01248 [Melipona quadrifasciata]